MPKEPASMQDDLLDRELEHLITEDDENVIDETASEETASETFEISSYGADYSTDGLVKRMKSGAFYVPEFQRSYVWNQRQASRFIESLLMGLPVPGIFVFREPDSARHLIVDGQQRLKTLQYYYAGLFKDRKFKLLDVNQKWANKSYDELDQDDRQRLDDAIVHTTIFRQDRPEDGKRSIYEVFERINTGGVKLSAQEIRACVSTGAFISLLGDSNDLDAWREIYGKKSERLKDQELILRFLALQFARESYKRPMRRFLNRFVDDHAKSGTTEIDKFKAAFRETIELAYSALGKQAFRPQRQINAAVFDAVMVGLHDSIIATGGKADVNKVKSAYEELLANEEFQSAYRKSTADNEQVAKRLALAIDAFKGC